MAAQTDDKKLDGAGLTTLWGIIKQYIADNPSIPKATASVLGGIMVGTTLGVNNSGVLNLASGIVTAGTYKSVTVDTYGRVTAGSNPNTLAGYGITDAKISNGSIILGENSITPITSLSGYATQTWVQQQGYLTEETYKGTVTQVKVGTTAYDPTSGVVSLPAYPTTLPASDVYSWAKAASKPSYTASEVGAATSGHTHTTSLASDTGTSTITLASAGKYKLTAGGTSVIFTMPTIPTVSYPVTSVNSKTGAVTLTASDVGAATSGHTHTTSIATSSGTNALTLAANTKYVLTAGGSTFIFTTPTDTNTWRPLGTGATDACAGNDSRLSDSRPASDVYSWAKASSKPTYTASEVGAATSGHTHTTSIATSTGTNQITLAHGGKYAITAGGTSYIFTMPSDNNTTYSAGTGLSLSGTTFSLATSGVTAGTYKRVTVDAYGRVTSGDNTDANDNTWRNIYTGGTSRVGTGTDTKAINFVAGSNVSISYEAAGTGSGQSGNANYFNVKIAATDTTYSAATQSAAGLMSAADKKKLDGIASGANAYSLPTASSSTLGGVKVGTTLSISSSVLNLATSGVTAGTYKRVTVDSYGRVTSGDNTDANDNTWRGIYVKGTSSIGNGINTKALNFAAGSNVSISFAAAGTGSGQSGNANYGTITINATDTTYSAATQSAAGLMSAADKKKLDGIASGANAYSLPAASTSALGGIKVNYTNSGKNYKVQLDSNNNAYVNVPWENTTYTIPTKVSQLTNDSGYITSYTNTWRNVYLAGTEKVGTGTGTKGLNFVAGSNVSISYEAAGTGSGQSGNANYFNIKIAATDTTYSVATQSANGLMSAADKTKLDGISIGSLMGSTSIGDTIQPIYWNGSAFKVISYTIAKSVPSDAKFTDTTYSAFTTSAAGLAPAASSTNKTTAESAVGNYYLCADGKYRQLPANAFKNDNTTYTFTNKGATLAWSTTSTIATVGGVDIKVTMPANPNTDHYAWTDITGKPNIFLSNSLYVADNYINGTKYTALNNGVYTHIKTQDSETLLHFQNAGASASGLDILFTYGQSSSAPLKYRKNIDNERFAATTWVDIIDSLNISSQSVNYATSAGDADTLDGYHHDSFLHTSGGTLTGDLNSNYDVNCNVMRMNNIICAETVKCLSLQSSSISSEILGSGTFNKMWWRLFSDHYEFEFPKTTDSGNGTNIPVYMGWRGGTYALTLAANTNVGIGTTSPSYKLHVNGACAATSFPNISDIRKKNIVKDNLSIGLNAIANAPLFDFTWKDVSLDKDLHIGSSAQYWKNVIPEAVTMAQDEMCTLSMQYDVIAFASIVSVAKETVTLKEKVALLETRVESLEKKIREYESN